MGAGQVRGSVRRGSGSISRTIIQRRESPVASAQPYPFNVSGRFLKVSLAYLLAYTLYSSRIHSCNVRKPTSLRIGRMFSDITLMV